MRHRHAQHLTQDPLTGLPNRRGVLDALQDMLAKGGGTGIAPAVLVFDIDGFKKANASHGHAGGDRVLRECMRRLSGLLGPADILARHGGNEFVLVQPRTGPRRAARMACAMQSCMEAGFMLDGQRFFFSASIGIALAPPAPMPPLSAPQLLQRAQMAMVAARAGGPSRVRFYREEMARLARDRADLEAMLRHAVARGQLALQYQPRVSLSAGGMVGVEALVRWRHPALGLIAPARFIPLAEETGLIDELDMWVLREACTRIARWRAAGWQLGRLSVNLSARQFQRPGLMGRVRAVLASCGLAPCELEIEITESTAMCDADTAIEVLRSLKALGVILSIDDFGTGYSSLSYLNRFPLDVLKIDRAFVSELPANAGAAAIVRAIVDLARALNLRPVAEGVETGEQAAYLAAQGVDEFQGYYFSRPLWPAQLEQFMARAGRPAGPPDEQSSTVFPTKKG